MTLDELEKLIKRAEGVLGCIINLSRDSCGKWSVVTSGPPSTRDKYGVGLSDCVDTIKKWATPPKPKTLTITLPTEHCEAIIASVNANGCCYIASASPVVAEMVEALKPYQEQP